MNLMYKSRMRISSRIEIRGPGVPQLIPQMKSKKLK